MLVFILEDYWESFFPLVDRNLWQMLWIHRPSCGLKFRPLCGILLLDIPDQCLESYHIICSYSLPFLLNHPYSFLGSIGSCFCRPLSVYILVFCKTSHSICWSLARPNQSICWSFCRRSQCTCYFFYRPNQFTH